MMLTRAKILPAISYTAAISLGVDNTVICIFRRCGAANRDIFKPLNHFPPELTRKSAPYWGQVPALRIMGCRHVKCFSRFVGHIGLR